MDAKYLHFFISLLLIFLLAFNSQVFLAISGSQKSPRRANVFSPRVETVDDSLIENDLPLPQQQDVKAAVIREVTTYLNQFKGTCFGREISIGDPAKYQAAINKSIYEIIVGDKGVELVNKRPDSQAYHDDTGWSGLLMANIVFPFDPNKLEEKKAYENRRTMAHELTHHMEYLKGVKIKGKPRSERNTDYQDGVVRVLKNLVQTEALLKDGRTTIGEELTRWGNVETQLRKLEAEGAGGIPPDAELEETTGFNARFEKIEAHYLSGACGEDLKKLVLLYRLLPRIRQTFEFDPLTIKLGAEASTKAVLQNTNYEELTVPAELKPRFKWTLPGGKISNENPVRYKPEREGDYTIPVELDVTFGKEDFVIARGDFNFTVTPDETKPVETGKTIITAPKEVLAAELFDAKAVIPTNLQSRLARYEWSPNSCSDQPKSLTPKLQFRNPYGGKLQQNQVLFTIFDGQNNRLDSVSVPVTVKPVLLGGSASDVWEGGSHPEGLDLKRKAATRKRTEGDKEINSAQVGGTITVRWATGNATELEKKLIAQKGQNGRTELRPISIGDFQGFLLETPKPVEGFTSIGGYVDAGSPSALMSGFGYVVKGCIVLEISYSAGGSGTALGGEAGFAKYEKAWWNDLPFLKSQTRAAAGEARAIIAGLALAPDGSIARTPYKGPKLDGSDTPTVKLAISPDAKKLKKGETVSVQAVVENAQPEDLPLQYAWTGEYTGSGETVRFTAAKPGKQTLSVSVQNIGGASVEFEVADYKAEIKQVSPTVPKVVFGAPVSFLAQLSSGGAPVSGNYIYRWQPQQPEAKFEPAESAMNQSKAVFTRPGRAKVWVQILEKKGANLETVAESDQLEIEVVSPTLKIAFDPATVNVGKEVKARVDVTPADLKDINFRWEISANGRQILLSPDTREFTFIPQDTNPVTVTARARVPFYGDDLGVQTATITATVSQAELDKTSAAAKLAEAKQIVRKGQLDEATALTDEAARLDPQNAEAAALSKKWKQDKATILTQLEKTRVLIEQQKFPEASNEFIVAKNLHNLYQPVLDLEKVLNEKWRDYDWGVRDGMGNIRLALEYRQFKKALQLAAGLRAKYKLIPVTEKDLQGYEQSAQTHEAEKERQRLVLKRGEEKYRNYDFAGAYEDLNVMFAKNDFYEYWNSNYDPEPPYYQKLKDDAFLKTKRINELLSNVRNVAGDERLAAPIVEKAIADCDEILKIQPPNAEAQKSRALLAGRLARGANSAVIAEAIKRGEALHSEKKYDEAVREFDRAINLEPANVEAYRLRGRSKREKGDLQGALNDFNRALELEPDNNRTLLGRGLVREKLGDLQGAMTDYTRGIQLDTKYPNGYSYRGLLKINSKDYRGAVADFDAAIGLEPQNVSAYINRGLAKARLGDNASAIGDYDRAIELDPKRALAYNNRGSAKEKSGDLKGALADYEKAVQLDPSDKLAAGNLTNLKAKIIETPESGEVEILNVNNIYGVSNKPTVATQFTLTKPHRITYVFTYHWNSARGTPRPGFIGFYNSAGQTFGPWQATGTPGQGGVPNANWEARPNVVLPAGTYTIAVSEMDTWSQNPQSGGRGFAVVKGVPAGGEVVQPTPQPTPVKPTPTPVKPTEGVFVVAVFENRSGENTHIFVEGESFGPQNRLAPGEKREVRLKMPPGGRIKFYAGRNGQVLTTRYWDGDPDDTSRYPRIVFDGSRLIVTTGLR